MGHKLWWVLPLNIQSQQPSNMQSHLHVFSDSCLAPGGIPSNRSSRPIFGPVPQKQISTPNSLIQLSPKRARGFGEQHPICAHKKYGCWLVRFHLEESVRVKNRQDMKEAQKSHGHLHQPIDTNRQPCFPERPLLTLKRDVSSHLRDKFAVRHHCHRVICDFTRDTNEWSPNSICNELNSVMRCESTSRSNEINCVK